MFLRYLQHLVVWGCIILNLVIYFRVIRTVRQEYTRVGLSPNGLILQFIWFPMILVICWLPVSIYRLYTLIFNDESLGKVALTMGFYTLNGLLNSAAYGMNDVVKKNIRRLFCCF